MIGPNIFPPYILNKFDESHKKRININKDFIKTAELVPGGIP